MATIKVENISIDMYENTLDVVSEVDQESIFGGNCQYAGDDFSPGSVIIMVDGNQHTCQDGWVQDYWT